MERVIRVIRGDNSKKGFTLIEVMAAVTILLILLIAFVYLIGWNFTSIFMMGEKSQAIASTKEKIDLLDYMIRNSNDLANDLNSDSECVTRDNLLTGSPVANERRFCYEVFDDDNPKQVEYDGEIEEIKGYEVTVVVFYNEGDSHVEFTSFTEKDNDI